MKRTKVKLSMARGRTKILHGSALYPYFLILLFSILLILSQQSCEKFRRVVKLSTNLTTNITASSCVVKGSILDLGDLHITAHGFCYATSEMPDLGNDHMDLGEKNTLGEFTDTLKGLSANTKYYVRAYAQDEDGEYFGQQLDFTTLDVSIPILTTNTVSAVTDSSAICGGHITDSGGETVKQRGVCWSLSTEPVYNEAGNYTNEGSGIGTYTSNITGLEPGREYFVRAYAINNVGIGYGSIRSFTTLTSADVPTVATHTEVTNLTYNSVTVSGNVIADGGASITEKGVFYSESEVSSAKPGDEGTITVKDGSGEGSITANLIELNPETKYFAIAYAKNSAGYGYGVEISFTTLAEINAPSVITSDIADISYTTINVTGNVTNDGGASVTETGFWYGPLSNPESNGTKIQVGDGTGPFQADLTDLIPGSDVYVKAYAVNSKGTSYGGEIKFTTLYAVLDYDGNIYDTIHIGSQVWLNENLRTTKYADGNAIPMIENDATWDGLTIPAYCWYNNDDVTYGATYGALYNWYAVNSDKLCPTGWHVPSRTEFMDLVSYLGNDYTSVGGKLKETGFVHWNNPNEGATNETGFTALPGGSRNIGGDFSGIKMEGYWWTSTEHDIGSSYFMKLHDFMASLSIGDYNIEYGFSVRCLKD